MEPLLRIQPHGIREALAASAQLVEQGVTAFLDGDAFRGRRVQESARTLVASLDQWHDDAVAAWPQDQDTFVNERALSTQIEVLAKTAQQLGGLAESRLSPEVRSHLRQQAAVLVTPLRALLAPLADPNGAPAPADTLRDLRSQRRSFVDWASGMSKGNSRLLSSYLLAVAAAQRIDEAAEAAVVAANLCALQVTA